jgi:hypothetical protein
MKKLRKVILPAAIILIGAGAAFATNAAKTSGMSEDGYYFDSSSRTCINPGQCSSVEGNTCIWEDASGTTHNLCRLGETGCYVQLAKLP